MDNTIKIKVSLDTIIDLMVAINNRIKTNKKQIEINRELGICEYNHKYIKIIKDLKKIHRALEGIEPILIEEVF